MGAPRTPRERVRVFWRAWLAGASLRAAGAKIGMSETAGQRWVVKAGGVIPDLVEPSGRYLSLAEREEIAVGLAAGRTRAEIARELGRHRSTIGREIERNHVVRHRPGGHGPPANPDAQGTRPYRRVCSPQQAQARAYRASTAQSKAEARARRPKQSKLRSAPLLAAAVQLRLAQRWSPEQISRCLPELYPEHPEMRVSHETIYQELYVQGRGVLRRELTSCLRTGRALRRPRRRCDQRRPTGIPDKVMISERPAEADDRAVPGHWEGDLIIGRDGASAIGTLVERSTRFVMLLHLPARHDAVTVRDAMINAAQSLPGALRRSLTWDQGVEMARHREISIAADLPIYFCDPHSPWQRGSNENTNGLLRQYFPKGSDLSVHTAEHLATVAAELNTRPRKTLNWATPARTLDQLLSAPPTTGVATTP